MKSLSLALLLLVTAFAWNSARSEDDGMTEDQRAVHAAIEDYVHGFYDAAPERLERSLASDLVKMGYSRRTPDAEWSGSKLMTFEQAIELAKTWNADGSKGKDMPYAIEVFEVVDKTAAAKLTAMWGQDYFHLAKEEGRWKIRHVIWQSAPR